jgi:hypothetical protein
MPPWLDMARTPMAAPETRILRALRWTWQALCLATAAAVGFFGTLRDGLGERYVVGCAGLLILTIGVTILYWTHKQAADTAFLAELGESE